MTTTIYYFTGTGNSLTAAKKIAAELEGCRLVPIASLYAMNGDVIPESDRIGIVCPVYFSGLPVMVAEFAGRLDLSRSTYTFSVVTFGGSGGSTALRQLDDILKKRSGRGLDAGFMVKMPGNYILLYGSPTGEKREKILAAADERLERIAKALKKPRELHSPFPPLPVSCMPWRTPGLRPMSMRMIGNSRSPMPAHRAAPAKQSVLQEISSSSMANRYGNTTASSAAGASTSARPGRSRQEKRRQKGYGITTQKSPLRTSKPRRDSLRK
jgi:flavodoxin